MFTVRVPLEQAYQFVREDVKEFMGVPIGARIKGTTVQRPSGVPKKPAYVPYPVPPAFPPHIVSGGRGCMYLRMCVYISM